jgi:subtilase family serine protease
LPRLRCLLPVLVILALAGCGVGAVPSQAPGRSASDAGATPADNTGVPGENATGLPGENATGLPGENATGLPGTQFSCSPVTAPGQARCTLEINVNAGTLSDPQAPAAMIPGLHPSDLIDAYAFPAQNAGGTVAVVDAYDDPNALGDLAVYRSTFGMPPCGNADGCFRKVNQRGQTSGYPSVNAGWSNETALDLAMVSAACPNCRIVLVEADSALIDDLGASVDEAATFAPKAISNSYYAAEWSDESSEGTHYRHPGISITASSGDAVAPFYPAASRDVTAVGGTTLTGSGGSWREQAWSHGGSGCSAYVAKPAWQHAAPCSSRSTVDVSVVADPNTGVAVFSSTAGGWIVAGGTSVGAPLVAGAYALAGNGVGPAYSYAHPRAFHPIGGTGYQAATGLGSPSGILGL